MKMISIYINVIVYSRGVNKMQSLLMQMGLVLVQYRQDFRRRHRGARQVWSSPGVPGCTDRNRLSGLCEGPQGWGGRSHSSFY